MKKANTIGPTFGRIAICQEYKTACPFLAKIFRFKAGCFLKNSDCESATPAALQKAASEKRGERTNNGFPL